MIENLKKVKRLSNKRNKHTFYLSTFGLVLFTIYISTQSLIFDSILKTNVLQMGVVFIVLLVLALRARSNNDFSLSFTNFDFIWLISIVFIMLSILYNYTIERNNEIFVYVTGFLFLVISKLEIERYIPAFKILKFFSVVYAMATIFHYIFTDFYHSFIFPFISSTAQQRMVELTNIDYYPGLGIAQPSMAAAPMIIGIGVIIAGFTKEEKPIKKIDYIYLILLFCGLNLTGKRSVLLWGIIASFLLYYFSREHNKKLNRSIKIILLSFISIFILIITMNYFKEAPFFSRIISTIEGLISGDDITSGRILLYSRAWELFLEYPVFGIGWGQFINITSGQLLSRDLSVHNVYLQLLAEVGLVGFTLIVTSLVYTYYKTFRYLKIVYNTSYFGENWRIGISFSFYYQSFFLLYCLSENPFYNIKYMFIYFFCISITSSFLIKKIKLLGDGEFARG